MLKLSPTHTPTPGSSLVRTWGGPGGTRRWQQAIALPVFAAALVMYGLTLAPTVVTVFDDSLEFQLITYKLGIAHPTGYPLYTLLGWLFTRLPVGDAAYRVNLMSAVFGAMTVALVYLIVLELNSPQPLPSTEKDLSNEPWISVLASLIGSLALAISPVFWSQATVAEVYTLNAAFVAGIIFFLARGSRQGRSRAFPLSEKFLMPLAFQFGLSLTHHRTMLLLLPAILFYLWHQTRTGVQEASEEGEPNPRLSSILLPSTIVKLLIALSAPLLLYLYLPLRGHIGSLDGTYTNTLTGFWEHITASGYGVFVFQNPFGAEHNAPFYFSLFLRQFGYVGLGAGLLGFAALRQAGARWLTGVAFVTYLTFNLFYRVADIQVFFIPLFLIWAVWIGVAAGWLLTGLGMMRKTRAWLRLPILMVIVALFAAQSAILVRDNLPESDRSGDWAVYDYGLDVMRQPLEPNAAIVGILGEVTLMRYFQATEGLRTDLRLIPADREADRLAAVARLLDEGRVVYLTRELSGAPARWSLSAIGPLIRVSPEPVLTAPGTAFPLGSSLSPEIALSGYTISRPQAHRSQPPVRLTLVWETIASLDRGLKVSARLMTADGQIVAQADAVPVHFAYPTYAWRLGEYVTDVYDLDLPATLQAGEYIPLVILYDPAQDAAEVGRARLGAIRLP